MRSIIATKNCAIAIFLLLAAPYIYAAEYLSGPADYIYSPRVEEGEREIDTKFGTQTPRNAEDTRQSGASIGFGYPSMQG